MSDENIKLKVLDKNGHTLMTCNADQIVSLVYTGKYKKGDRIALEIRTPGRYCIVQFEDTMPPVLVYIQKREINFSIPFGEQATVYSPKSFQFDRHVIRARMALPEEIATRRNLALNPYDQHGDNGFYPHASANVETRGESVFAARNAIDGIFENTAHGEYPYQSWGINRDPDAALTISFGREILPDEIRLTLRGDYPHDNYWISAQIDFYNGKSETLSLTNSLLPQCFPVHPGAITSLTISKLIQADGPSPFPALTQIEVWGSDIPK